MRLAHFVALASLIAASLTSLMVGGCGSDSTPAADAGPFVTELACPTPGSFPFVTSEFDWQVEANERGPEIQPRIKHQPADILSTTGIGAAYTDVAGNAPLVTGNHLVRGVVARIEAARGGFANAIPEEFVSAWEYSDAGGWVELGMQVSGDFAAATPGGYSIETATSSLSAESVIRYSVLNAEGSCAVHHAYELAPGRKVVLADIDATLTVSDEEILNQIPDAAYDPIEMGSSVALTQAWAAKGYQLLYLTARPHIFRIETREWLKSHGYPDGPGDHRAPTSSSTKQRARTKANGCRESEMSCSGTSSPPMAMLSPTSTPTKTPVSTKR